MQVTPEQQYAIDTTPLSIGGSVYVAPTSPAYSYNLDAGNVVATPGKPVPSIIPIAPNALQNATQFGGCGSMACGSSPMSVPAPVSPPMARPPETPKGDEMCTQAEQQKWWILIAAAGVLGYLFGKK